MSATYEYGQRGDLPYEGCDIYKINLQTRQIVRLTSQEFTPNTGAGKWNYADPTSTGSQKTGLGFGLAVWGCYTVYLILRDPEDLAKVENHPSWTHMYLMMMAAQIGFAAAYL
jgi:hypothetical protein